ncbi:MAG TPA: hypothetical protein VGY66_19370 [Gemmataceae bacterium]|jgi:hypothetical protein|nr:hypothetical protein [Gemmataceae bacterium]
MSIKFICSCGKHLRAREEMAGRRSVCPQCGMPVGIPLLNPTHPGGPQGHMTPAERLRHQARRRKVDDLFLSGAAVQPAPGTGAMPTSPPSGQAPSTLSEELFPRPLDPALVRLVGGARPQHWRLETRWYQCLLYPLRAWWLILPMATVLSLIAAGTLLVLPEILSDKFPGTLPGAPYFRFACTVLGVPYIGFVCLILGYVCSVPEGALTSGFAGEFRHIHWAGRSVWQAVRSFIVWFFCFLSGPFVFMITSLIYWIHCGDPGLLDWFILVELNIMGVSYGLLTLLSFCRRERLADVNPWQVALLIHRADYRVLGLVFATASVVLAHGLALLAALSRFQHDTAAGSWLLIMAAWLSGLFCTTFLLRLTGIWCNRARV